MGFLAVLIAVAVAAGVVWAGPMQNQWVLAAIPVGAILAAWLGRASGRWALMMAVIGAVVLGAAVAGLWMQQFPWQSVLGYALGAGVVLSVHALLSGLVAVFTGQDKLSAVIAIAAAVGIGHIPVQQIMLARSVPPIHDITTDLDNPPAFVAIAPLRQGAPNPPEYAGPDTAKLQREAPGYADIKPVILGVPVAEAFARAHAAAKAMQDWQVVEAVEAEGRIEATATTFWMRFKDDIVIRVTADPADPAKSRIDIRSKSRVGRSDAGRNAQRIREYVAKLTAPA